MSAGDSVGSPIPCDRHNCDRRSVIGCLAAGGTHDRFRPTIARFLSRGDEVAITVIDNRFNSLVFLDEGPSKPGVEGSESFRAHHFASRDGHARQALSVCFAFGSRRPSPSGRATPMITGLLPDTQMITQAIAFERYLKSASSRIAGSSLPRNCEPTRGAYGSMSPTEVPDRSSTAR